MNTPDLTPGTWAQLNQLLDQALDLPEGERARWLEELPPALVVHADRLRALLASASTASPLDALPRLDDDLARTLDGPSRDVGPYHLLRCLGEGGMGTVWLAERRDVMTQRQVALKLPRASWQGSTLARLEREREILATLNHPNIARLLDAGVTPQGNPYLALEYVEGRPIDVHANEEQLSLRARLELFTQVLAAVAHAHGRLVVHRDLKPSNVLVTRDGQVRLLDFGIAKLIAGAQWPDPQLTQLAGPAFTPNYASPEQLSGEPIGVASDIYSLGVLLYELLAQTQPYRLRRDGELPLHESLTRLAIPAPSEKAATRVLKKALAGDLDTLVLKAMKFSADERYPNANAFADDIARFLGGYPLLAQPDTARYRVRKLVLRHRGAVAVTVALSLSVLGGTSAALWQAHRATAEQHRAEEVIDYLTGMLRDASPYGAPGRSLSAVELLRRARGSLDRIGAQRPALRVELLNLLGSTLLDLGDLDASEQVASQALEEASAGLALEHPQRLRARLLNAEVYFARGRDRELGEALEQLMPSLERGERTQPADLVRALECRARLALEEVRPEAGRRDAQRAFELALARLGERDGRTVDSAVLLAESYQYGERDFERALQEAERGLSFALRAYEGQPAHPHVIAARDVYGRALCRAGQSTRAVEELTRALRDATEALGPTSPMVGMISINRVSCERRLGLVQQALDDGTRGLELRSASMKRDSRSWGNSHAARGQTLLAARRPQRALEDLSAAVESLGQGLGERHRLTLWAKAHRSVALASLGRTDEALAEVEALRAFAEDLPAALLHDALFATVYRLAGRPADARQLCLEALEHLGGDPQRAFIKMRVLFELGLAELDLGLAGEAEASLTEALALSATEQRVDSPLRADAWVGLARALLAGHRTGEALALLKRADDFWRAFDPDNPWGADAASRLSGVYLQLGRRAEAGQALTRAQQLRQTAPTPLP